MNNESPMTSTLAALIYVAFVVVIITAPSWTVALDTWLDEVIPVANPEYAAAERHAQALERSRGCP